ncbi:hypothetical protein [Roseivivax sp. CAU 1753]
MTPQLSRYLPILDWGRWYDRNAFSNHVVRFLRVCPRRPASTPHLRQRILGKLIAMYGSELLIREKDRPIAHGSRSFTQIIQRLVSRAQSNRTPEQVARKLLEPTEQGNVNWYSIRRTYADWLDKRVSGAAISAVMGHFKNSSRTRRQLFETGSPTTDLCKRRKLGPVLEVAAVLDEEWRPFIQPFTSVDLRSESRRLMHADARN